VGDFATPRRHLEWRDKTLYDIDDLNPTLLEFGAQRL
jgi:hypothetical protein